LFSPIPVRLDEIQQQVLDHLCHPERCMVVERVHVEIGGVSDPRHVDLAQELAATGVRRYPFVIGMFLSRLAADARVATVAVIFLLFFIFVFVVVRFGKWWLTPANVRVRLVWLAPELPVG
jgi:hypothetical protein